MSSRAPGASPPPDRAARTAPEPRLPDGPGADPLAELGEEAAADGTARRRRQDFAVLLPVFGMVMFLPPVIHVFRDGEVQVLGLPLIVAWLFGAWLLLILLAFRLARLLRADMPEG